MEYAGLLGGTALGLMGWLLGRAAARKKGGLDEVHRHVWRRARSASWYVTLIAIYVLLALGLLDVEIGLVPALAILMLVHLAGWSVSGAWFMAAMAEGDPAETRRTRLLLAAFIGIAILTGFAIVSALTGNWLFFLFSLVPVFFSTLLMHVAPRLTNKGNRSGT